ncbi:PR domain zinc finger protein 5 [Eumeta japonica]|uniref:PR domain zinc finger protein 5 n=1 Tax=Eumeta variegata TaxID=151549 RepID=A0A4C1VY19_EUMVA|nr:PR domain zinc finger protein 5 [Eumeta japonica]
MWSYKRHPQMLFSLALKRTSQFLFLGARKAKSKQQKDWTKIAEIRGNGPILRENSLKLLANSTICVFQWNRSRYRCFCCQEPFSDMPSLRDHTNNRHTLKDIERIIISQQNRLVKVEISTLSCKICSVDVTDLESLKTHLVDIHDLEFGLTSDDLLVPFKLESGSLKCQLCLEDFKLFRLLNIHMNKHFQKHVCHVCGAGFSNLVFLNMHKVRIHKPQLCKECGLKFSNRVEKRDHDVSMHNVKIERKLRFPCPYCQERFFQEYFRVQHLVDKHGIERPEYKCPICDKKYLTKSLCTNHVKNVHMKEKNHECDLCSMRFYTKSDKNRHRVTHTGEKNFVCTFCTNLFATKDSLRRHIKRTHIG